MDATNLSSLLRQRATERGDQVAVQFPRGKRLGSGWTPITFAEIDRRADAYAAGFLASGLRRGDRTLLMVKPSEDFYPMAFGLFRMGAVPVFIDPGMGLKNALRCVETIAPRAVIAASPVHAVRTLYRRPFRSAEVFVTAGRRWWWGGDTLAQAAAADPNLAPTDDPRPDEDAVIVFTSGSTGPAKGVALTHACMTARVRQIQALFDLHPGETISETLLVYSVLEMLMGLTVVIPPMDLAKPATVDPAAVAETLSHFAPDLASASPVVWQRFVRHAIATGQRFDHLRLLLTSAAPIPVDLHQRLSQVVPATTELYTPYGATEAMPVARIGSATILGETAAMTARGEGTCVGTVAPGTDVRILEPTEGPVASWDEAPQCPPGRIGEIVVRGDGVSTAYRNAPEANAQAKIPDGDTIWHRMGDLGTLDTEGRLWFCGRVSHRVTTSEGVVPSVPVEGIYNQHPAVYRSALVGVGPEGAQVPVLAVELEEGHRWSEALEAELATLADGTRWAGTVTALLPHPGFPTDARHNSKIRREDLRDWAAARVGRTA